MSNTLNQVMENFGALSLEDKEYVSEQIGKILIEARREEVYQVGQEGIRDYKEGKLKGYSNIDDLMTALNEP